jgi:putative Holliday junction resolvase
VIPASGRVLGLDWGTSRIGVAISDETQLVASALDTLTRRAGRRLPLAQFLTLVTRERPVGLVVGLPLDDDGREGESAAAARAMGVAFAARSYLPVDWIDESFTTARMLEVQRELGRRPQPQARDALAAAELLQRWLEARR